MTATTLAGQILTEGGFVSGRLRCTAAIRAIEPAADAPADRFVLPGFIDLHVHGGARRRCHGRRGGGAADGAVPRHARHHGAARDHGDRAASTICWRRSAASARRWRRADPAAARVLGRASRGPVHQPAGARRPAAVRDRPRSRAGRRARRAGADPGRDHGARDRPGRRLAERTSGRSAHARRSATPSAAMPRRRGARRRRGGFTHLFNAMSGLHHRRPGAVGAALAHGEWAELILDLVHVEEGAARAALRAIPVPVLHHGCRGRDRHAARRVSPGPAPHLQRGERRPSRRRHACRQRPDHGPGAAQPSASRHAARARPHGAARRSRPTISGSRTAAG